MNLPDFCIFALIFLFQSEIQNVIGLGPGLQIHYERNHLKPPSFDGIPKFPLPRALVPTNYHITIMPILDEFSEVGEQFTAPGTVKITLDCEQDTNRITLHSFLIDINNETVAVTRIGSTEPLEIQNQEYEEAKHFYHIDVADPGLVAGSSYEVTIDYIAPVSTDRVNGLYLASYVDPQSNETRHIAATQLEPARARQVFPCFDEPRWKPTFDVTIGRSINYTSLCNSPLRQNRTNEEYPDWFWDEYETTVKMPTYLFAMAVSDYSFAEADASLYRLPVKTYAANYLIESGVADYSAEATAKIIDYFETLYGIDYPMPKVDNIVVPGKGGAMENYGLITYGNFLMYDPNETTEAERQRLVNVISHELAHQWFGNLVTCVSWSHIYLNEGFATYVSYVGEEPFYNEFYPRKYILNDAVQSAFLLDAGPLSHPLVVENIYAIPDISAHFSSLQYDKGAALIRMMEGFLTENTLNDGLRKYLLNKTDDVAEQDELFYFLNEQAHLDGTLPLERDVKEIMDTWTLQKGFPLVRVSYLSADTILLSQERFTSLEAQSKSNNEAQDENDLWEIPISVATETNPNFSNYTPAVWLEKNIAGRIYRHDTSTWIMINSDGMGFYRVLYDSRLFDMILQQLQTNYSVISPLSRSQLLDNYLNLAWQGYVNIETALSVTEYLAQESDFTVWNAFFTAFRSSFILLTASAESSDVTSRYLLPRIDGALRLIGIEQLESDAGALVLLRAQLLDWACAAGHEGCLNYSRTLLQKWEENPDINPFPLDLQPVLYCSAISNGDLETFTFFTEKYRTETSIAHKTRIVSALGACVRPEDVFGLIGDTFNETGIYTKSDREILFQRLGSNPNAYKMLFPIILYNLPQIILLHGSATPIANTIYSMSTFFSTAEELNQVRELISNNEDVLSEVQSTINLALETIERNIQWKANYFERIKNWFETHTGR